ncbi:unnamed protein product [Zymoseptoria tritici ST99CH_3D1]|nr:unnamed protein product [Zymoseptoria tritici ST99CH_3D1]
MNTVGWSSKWFCAHRPGLFSLSSHCVIEVLAVSGNFADVLSIPEVTSALSDRSSFSIPTATSFGNHVAQSSKKSPSHCDCDITVISSDLHLIHLHRPILCISPAPPPTASAEMEWTGSPPTKKASALFSIFDDENTHHQHGMKRTTSLMPLPQTNTMSASRPILVHKPCSMETPVNELLAKLNAQQELLSRQKRDLQENEQRSASSSPTDPYAITPPSDHASRDRRPGGGEVAELKKQLEVAQERMAQMDLQLTQSRLAQHTMEEAIGSPFPTAQHLAANIANHNMLPVANGQVPRGTYGRSAGNSFERSSFNTSVQTSFDSMPSFNRPQSGYGHPSAYEAPPLIAPLSFQAPYGMPSGAMSSQSAPVGTRLSPTASEFGTGRQYGLQQASATPTFVSTTEPLNYRRLLDRHMSCNWKYVVDKIVCNNDQQASIFLQQKLKVATSEQKVEIVQAIIEQAYPLMVNRFGNFLVQRCFEHGSPEQIILIAQAIRGNTLNLSMDAFGCHVVQKAFDCVPEEYKAIMVHELLRRIPETVIHRYACHVWQKLFELRWSDSPPQIMKFVNEALRGMWHEVALGETGSLVVQNIFENCLEEDKRPCVNEVLASIDVVAHGQFGNWCIQHICEHGSIPDRTRAVDHVIRYATEYSLDQFASKVVEKCLKIGGNEFLDRYLDRVCEARPDRPRMPLIDIAGDQFGNYLIQYILVYGEPSRRELVSAHIRKHMVSLRGSKYGSRVAMACCNPAVATRPGPPLGAPLSRAGNGYMGGERQYGGERLYVERPTGPRGGFGGGYR